MTFEQLYTTYFADVYRFSLWLSRDPSDAEDLASETFVRAWAQQHRWRTETLKAYLLAIARRAFIDQRRKARAREELPQALADQAPDALRRASARMDLDRVTRAIAEMAESDRLALVLRAEQSLPYAEIARVLEMSEGSVRVKVCRARRRLLDALLSDQGGNNGSHS
jgi:RNA polymerase sigma-70 factor (ECF subfamily)